MGILNAVILSMLLPAESASTSLIQRKRQDVISVPQRGTATEKLTTMFWDNDQQRDVLSHGSEKHFTLNRILQDRVTMSMTTMAPASPILTSAPAAPVSATSTPAFAPARDCEFLSRDQVLLELLASVSNNSQIEDPSSLQGVAYESIMSTTLDPCGNPSKSLSFYGLSVLYFSTQGANWTDNTGWIVDSDSCEWYGVTCNSEGEVTEIILASNNLQGTLPSEMGAIESLQVLSLYSNNLTGEFPATVKWPNMKLIDLENNQLVGHAFPHILSQLISLEVYRVSNNLLTGHMAAAPFRRWPHLQQLWIANNSIFGFIPNTISSSKLLESFVFYSNNITGTIPPEIGTLNLTEFQAYDNLLSGPIPVDFWNNTFLVDLRLEKNFLTGTIASEIGELTYLQSLRLAENEFTGTLPPEMMRLSNLVILSVSGTKLMGTIRDAYEPFGALEFADFSKAWFTGTLPKSLFDVLNIKALYFNDNALSGTIPSNYASSLKLMDLYLNGNSLSGSIPAIDPGQMGNLTELLFDNNDLSGVMPSSICDLQATDSLALLTADYCTVPPKVVCDCCDSCSSEVPP